jgi:hypothetical protein
VEAEETLRPGTRVELVDPLYGYDVNSSGTVVQVSERGTLLVRFDSTGHAMYVSVEHLRPA